MAADLRFALRMILAHRWFSLAVVATLALGIGLNTMVFTLINAALFKPVPVPGGARLVAVTSRAPGNGDDRLSYPDLLDYRAQSRSFAALEGAADQEGVLGEPGNPPQAYHLERATFGIFSMLHIHPILGRDFLPSDAQTNAAPVLMIGYTIWQNRYAGSPSVIGRQVRVNEKPATIIGVMPKGFMFPTVVDMWMPLAPTPNDLKRDNRQLQVFGLLQPGVNIAVANAELSGIAHRLAAQYSDTDKGTTALVMSFHERYNGGNIKMIFILMLASVGFVLLIACANVANMMLSRAIGRQREMSIRAALGASRWRVVRQLLIESVLLSVFGGLAGLGLAAFGVHWFDLATSDVSRPYWVQFTMDYSVFGYFAALCILCGLLFGMVPALRSSRPDLNQVLQEGARTVGRLRGGRFSAVFVIFQFALTLVLLTGAGIFVHSLLKTLATNKSIPARSTHGRPHRFPPRTLQRVADAIQRFYDQLLPRVQRHPRRLPRRGRLQSPRPWLRESPIEIEHAPVSDPAHRPVVAFDHSRRPAILRPSACRSSPAATSTPSTAPPRHQSAILTRDASQRFWPGQSALGKRFRIYDDRTSPVTGSPSSASPPISSRTSIEQDPKPLFFVPFRQEGWGGIPSSCSPPPIPLLPSAPPCRASIRICPSATSSSSPAPSSTSSGISRSSAGSSWDSPSSPCSWPRSVSTPCSRRPPAVAPRKSASAWPSAPASATS